MKLRYLAALSLLLCSQFALSEENKDGITEWLKYDNSTLPPAVEDPFTLPDPAKLNDWCDMPDSGSEGTLMAVVVEYRAEELAVVDTTEYSTTSAAKGGASRVARSRSHQPASAPANIRIVFMASRFIAAF